MTTTPLVVIADHWFLPNQAVQDLVERGRVPACIDNVKQFLQVRFVGCADETLEGLSRLVKEDFITNLEEAVAWVTQQDGPPDKAGRVTR